MSASSPDIQTDGNTAKVRSTSCEMLAAVTPLANTYPTAALDNAGAVVMRADRQKRVGQGA